MKKKETIKRLEKNQKIFDDLSSKIEKLKEFEKDFREFSGELNELKRYYLTDWIKDIDAIKDDKDSVLFTITSQDAIWNLISEHYEYNKRLLKVLIDELNS